MISRYREMPRHAAILALVALTAACGGGAAAGGGATAVAPCQAPDPCDGECLSLGEAAASCRVADEPSAPPPDGVVVASIVTRTLASGVDGVLEVELRNVSDAPIVLDFPGTLSFEPSLLSGERRVDERWEISGIASGSVQCRPGADCRTVRVRLAPGGRLVASLPMSGRVEVLRDGPRPGTIARSDGGPIPPGTYEAQVVLPWMDEVAGSTTGARRARVVRGPVEVR